MNWDDLKKRPLSYSSLKEFRKSPLHYMHYRDKVWMPPTDAMKIGLLAEHLLIESSKWEDKFIMSPDINRRTNAGKEEYSKFIEQADLQGKTIINTDMLAKADAMVEVAMMNPMIVELLKYKTRTQKKLFWREHVEWNGNDYFIPMIGYTDFEYSNTELISIDVKTCRDASNDKFGRDVGNMWYYGQMGVYSMGYHKTEYKFPKMMWVVMETTEPYGSNVIELSQRDLDYAKAEVKALLVKFVQCLEEKRFDEDYKFFLRPEQTYNTYHMPPWLKNSLVVYDED